jgi:hypothetical protein
MRVRQDYECPVSTRGTSEMNRLEDIAKNPNEAKWASGARTLEVRMKELRLQSPLPVPPETHVTVLNCSKAFLRRLLEQNIAL